MSDSLNNVHEQFAELQSTVDDLNAERKEAFYDMRDLRIANEELQRKLADLTECIGISIGLKCPACDDVGWYVAFNGEQEQCEFCYTCPDSIFNRKAALKESE